MKNFVKYGVAGLIGYFIGFYEMKYKITKVMLQGLIEKDKEEKESEQ